MFIRATVYGTDDRKGGDFISVHFLTDSDLLCSVAGKEFFSGVAQMENEPERSPQSTGELKNVRKVATSPAYVFLSWCL
jgi:hypothetical protein